MLADHDLISVGLQGFAEVCQRIAFNHVPHDRCLFYPDTAVGKVSRVIADVGMHNQDVRLAGTGQQFNALGHGTDHAGSEQGSSFLGVAFHEVNHEQCRLVAKADSLPPDACIVGVGTLFLIHHSLLFISA